MIDKIPNGDWSSYKRTVLNRLTRIESAQEKFEDRIMRELAELHEAVVVLKIKAGVWGLVAGAIPVLIAIGLKQL
ncbi:MAG: hypothetical protein JRD69_09885 [Deltaproteobacteria bacterium]|nr:hypothetical protein [Deltaproteobacteria bacterium]